MVFKLGLASTTEDSVRLTTVRFHYSCSTKKINVFTGDRLLYDNSLMIFLGR